jgi:hypothetical protein
MKNLIVNLKKCKELILDSDSWKNLSKIDREFLSTKNLFFKWNQYEFEVYRNEKGIIEAIISYVELYNLNVIEIDHFEVIEKRSRVGTRIINEFINKIRKSKFKEIRLNALDSTSFWEKTGFSKIYNSENNAMIFIL